MSKWKLKKISELDIVIADGNYSSKYPKSDEFISEGVPFIRANNISGFTVIDNDMYFISVEKHRELKKGHLLENDILITTRGNLGQVASVPAKYIDANINAQLVLLRPNCHKINYRYLMWTFQSRSTQQQIRKYQTGTALKQLPVGKLKKIEIPLPPLEVQRKIAETLDAASELLAMRKGQLAELDRLIQAVFYEMFGDPVTNEKGWEVESIGNLAAVRTGSTPNRSVANYYSNAAIPWIKTAEVANCYIETCDEYISELAVLETNCKLFPKNTILIAMYGQGKTRGQVGVLRINAATNQACAAVLPSNNYSTDFLYHLLIKEYDTLRNLGRGGNQPNLNLSIVKNFKVFSPPLPLQAQFAEIVQKIEEQKTLVQKSIDETQALFDSLMSEYFE